MGHINGEKQPLQQQANEKLIMFSCFALLTTSEGKVISQKNIEIIVTKNNISNRNMSCQVGHHLSYTVFFCIAIKTVQIM